jgi:hypothetical protein
MGKTGQIGTVLVFVFVVGMMIGIFYFIRAMQTQTFNIMTGRSVESTSYPDSKLTPGDIKTDTMEIVCPTNYGERAKTVNPSVQQEVFNSYGQVYPNDGYVIDHLIPVELGGSSDPKNLWPQKKEEARKKDIAETYLRRLVCDGGYSLPQAQYDIKKDWYAVYTQADIQ